MILRLTIESQAAQIKSDEVPPDSFSIVNRHSSIVNGRLSRGRFRSGGPSLAFATQRANPTANPVPALFKAFAGRAGQVAGALGDVVASFLAAHGSEKNSQTNAHPQSK